MKQKFIVAITGASGSLYAMQAIKILKMTGHHVAVIISGSGFKTIKHELDLSTVKDVLSTADEIYDNEDIAAPTASGSHPFDTMVIIPCTINTMAMIHGNIANTLITRSALVAQKEGRNLILVPRETPLSTSMLKQLHDLSANGVKIFIPAPSFYAKPESIDDIVEHTVNRMLQQACVKIPDAYRWGGM